jgi:hypothetical protein
VRRPSETPKYGSARPLAPALALEGHRVTALTARSAAIGAQSGTVFTCRRHNKPALGPHQHQEAA